MKTIARGTDAAFDRLAHFDEPPGTTTELRTPRRLPQLRAPRWLDLLTEHRLTARVSWTVCAVCLTASAVLVGVMLATGPVPAAPPGSTPRLSPAPSAVSTTPRAVRSSPPPVRSSARPSAGPTRHATAPQTSAPSPRTSRPSEPVETPTAPRSSAPSTPPSETPRAPVTTTVTPPPTGPVG